MMLTRLLHRDDKGIGAVEFALIAPVLISFIIGVSQLGRLFYANADMKNATAHAARLASIYRPDAPLDDATLIAAVKDRLMREGATSKVTVTVTRGTDNGNPYVQLKTDYSVPLEFIFFSPPPVTLHDTRRVYTQVTSANSTTYTAPPATTTTTSASSSAGTSASTSATSAGGTTSTSTSATSAGGTTSTSTTTSATSSGSNGNGNSNGSNGSNGNGNGHGHGNCPGC